MGQQAHCVVTWNERSAAGEAHLESDKLILRGTIRLSIPLKEIASLSVQEGTLHVHCAQGKISLALGVQAQKWADKIRNPKSLIDKLGVKEDSRVSVLGVEDALFWSQLEARTPHIERDELCQETDLIFVAINKKAELGKLAALIPFLKKAGALWVVRPKGTKAITDNDVRAAAAQVGLVDIKVSSFSNTHSAEKLVIPVKKR